jgi:hypothetical protein
MEGNEKRNGTPPVILDYQGKKAPSMVAAWMLLIAAWVPFGLLLAFGKMRGGKWGDEVRDLLVGVARPLAKFFPGKVSVTIAIDMLFGFPFLLSVVLAWLSWRDFTRRETPSVNDKEGRILALISIVILGMILVAIVVGLTIAIAFH